MKKAIALILTLVLIVTTVSVAAADGNEFPKMTLVLSDPNPETNAWGQGLVKFKEYVEEKTNGNVTVDEYLSSSLIPQDQELEALMKGTIDICQVSWDKIIPYYPEYGMLNAGYVFKDFAHYAKFMHSDVAKEIYKRLEDEMGILMFEAPGYIGARNVNLNVDRKVTSRADLSDIKLRTINSDSWIMLGKALGGNVTPLSLSDLYLALQTGACDGQENPVSTIKANSFYEVTKSLTLTGHLLSTVGLGINAKKWESFSPELQQVILDGAILASNYATELAESQIADDIKFMEDAGLIVYELTDEELTSYRQEVLDYILGEPSASGKWDMDLYKAISDMA